MQRIDLPWFIETLEAIETLGTLQAGEKIGTAWPSLFSASQQLDAMFDQSIYRPHLNASRKEASELRLGLDELIGRENDHNNLEPVLTQGDVWLINFRRNRFRIAFMSELRVLPLFLATPKENYSLNLLIDNGIGLFPPTLMQKVPEALSDAMEAGRCLAFQVATACGFHVYRVTESVLKAYWDAVSGGQPRPRLETIGNYATELEGGKYGSMKVWEALKQLAKLHRNPLIHPDVILSVEEAIGTIGMCRSVIGTMLTAIPDAEDTASTPTASP